MERRNKIIPIVLFIVVLFVALNIAVLYSVGASSFNLAEGENQNTNNDGSNYDVVDGYEDHAASKEIAEDKSNDKFKDDLFLGSLIITITITLLCFYFYTKSGKPLPTELRVEPRNDFYYHNYNYESWRGSDGNWSKVNDPSYQNSPTNTGPEYGSYEQQYQDLYSSLEQWY